MFLEYFFGNVLFKHNRQAVAVFFLLCDQHLYKGDVDYCHIGLAFSQLRGNRRGVDLLTTGTNVPRSSLCRDANFG